MKVVVAGSRTIKLQAVVDAAITSAFNKWFAEADDWKMWYRPEIVSGGAYGVDWLGEKYAKKAGLPVRVFPAAWDAYGKGAGYIRNKQMAEYADALIAVWDGKSKGTQHMIKIMEALGKPVYVYKV